MFRVESMLSGDTARVIWVTVSVEESQTWRLVDHDLETSLELSPGLALLGGRTVVKTAMWSVFQGTRLPALRLGK